MKTDKPTVNVQWRSDRGGAYYIVVRWKGQTWRKATGFTGTTKTGWRRIPEVLDQLEAVETRINAFGKAGGGTFHPWADNAPEGSKKGLPEVLLELGRVRNLAPHTMLNYQRALELYLERFGSRIPDTDTTVGWAKELRRTFSNASIWAYFTCLKSLFNFGVGRGYFDKNPFDWAFSLYGYKPRQNPRARTEEEVKRLWDYFRDGDKYAGIWLAGYSFCGLALADLIRVDWEHLEPVELDGGRFYYFTIERQKTNQTARVVAPVNRKTLALVSLMAEVVKWPYSLSVLSAKVNLKLGKLDFEPKLCYYECRHTKATRLVNANAPLTVISSLLGRNVRGLETYIKQVSQNEVLANWVSKSEKIDVTAL